MSKESTSSIQHGGTGIAGLLTVAFVVLKLCHVIDWSWWWVVSPLGIRFALFLVILAVAFVIAAISLAVNGGGR